MSDSGISIVLVSFTRMILYELHKVYNVYGVLIILADILNKKTRIRWEARTASKSLFLRVHDFSYYLITYLPIYSRFLSFLLQLLSSLAIRDDGR